MTVKQMQDVIRTKDIIESSIDKIRDKIKRLKWDVQWLENKESELRIYIKGNSYNIDKYKTEVLTSMTIDRIELEHELEIEIGRLKNFLIQQFN